MKKTLLIIMALAFCVSMTAQQAQYAKVAEKVDRSVKLQKTAPVKYLTKSIDKYVESGETTPILRSSPLLPADENMYAIGETFYNTITNGFARNTISYREDSNDAAAVWIIGKTTNNRGTGINYFRTDDNSGDPWGAIPDAATGRIEKARSGWGTHAFTKEGEIIVSHHSPNIGTNQGLNIHTRAKWGEGDWEQQYLGTPTSYTNGGLGKYNSLWWPSMFAVEDTVHIFAVTESAPGGSVMYLESRFPDDTLWGYKGYMTYPIYYRSTDGGKTWDHHVDFGPAESGGIGLLDSYETFKFSGDDYVVTAKGSHVVILFSTVYGMVYYLESKDNGNTWKKHNIYHIGKKFLDTIVDDPILEFTLLPRSASVTIDENGIVHVAFAVVMNGLHHTGLGTYWKWPVGMCYWNNSMDTIANDLMKAYVPEDENEPYIEYFLEYPGYFDLPSVIGASHFFCTNEGPGYDRDQFHDNGWAAFSRLYVENGKVYIAYQSPLDHPISFTDGSNDLFCRGVFVTVSKDYGRTWDAMNNTSWMTYGEETLLLDWSNYTEQYWPRDSAGWILWYPGIIEAGIQILTENGYPTMSYNTKNNSALLQWFYHGTTPFPNDPEAEPWEKDEIYVMTMTQDLNKIPEFNNVSKIYKSQCTIKPTGVGISDSADVVTIIWDAPCQSKGIDKFVVYRDGVEIGTVGVTTECKHFWFKDETCVEGTTYSYSIGTNFTGSKTPTVEYRLGDNFKFDDNCVVDIPKIPGPGVGIKTIPVAPTVKLYPNPTNGNVTILVDANSSPYILTISNIMGQTITTMKGVSNHINLNVSDLAPGVYIVNVRTAGAMTSQKLIVR